MLPDWEQEDWLPEPIVSPDRSVLRRGTRVIEFPGKSTERRGTFVGWKWHKPNKSYYPVVRWDGRYTQRYGKRVWQKGFLSFTRLEAIELLYRQLELPFTE